MMTICVSAFICSLLLTTPDGLRLSHFEESNDLIRILCSAGTLPDNIVDILLMTVLASDDTLKPESVVTLSNRGKTF